MRIIQLAICLIIGLSFQANAQKVGYTSVAEISESMPEVKLAQANLANERKRREDQLEADLRALQQKGIELEKNYQTYSPQQAEQIQRDLQSQQQALNQRYQTLSQEFQKKVETTLAPIETKIANAVKSVAVEETYTDYQNIKS